jgi:hypothetical protein
MVSSVTPARTWTLLAVGLILGLAGLVRMTGPPGGPDELTGVIRLPPSLTRIIVTLFVLSGILFAIGFFRRLRLPRPVDDEPLAAEASPTPAWLRTLRQVLSIVNIVVLAYLLWRIGFPLAELTQGFGGAGAPVPEGSPGDAPPLVNWTFGILGLVAGVGALALAVSIVFADRLAEWWRGPDPEPTPPPLAAAVEESLEDLRGDPDARHAIIRCYARFERAAAECGLARKPWVTPMEFMRETLERLPGPRGAVSMLTRLFELARFSRRELGSADRDRALGALDEIKAAIEERKADVVGS